MTDKYLMITATEDGDVYFQIKTKAQIEAEITERHDPEIYDQNGLPKFLDSIPNMDVQEWPAESVLILPWKPVVPQAVEVKTKWELPS